MSREIEKQMAPFVDFVDYIWDLYNYRERRRSCLKSPPNSAYRVRIEIYIQRFCMATQTHQHHENLIIDANLEDERKEAFNKAKAILEKKVVADGDSFVVKRPISITSVTIYSTMSGKAYLNDSISIYLSSPLCKKMDGHRFYHGEIETERTFSFHNTFFVRATQFKELITKFSKSQFLRCSIDSNTCRDLLF